MGNKKLNTRHLQRKYRNSTATELIGLASASSSAAVVAGSDTDILNVEEIDNIESKPLDTIARVICPRGQSLFECVRADGETILLQMPPKFRNIIWIRRGVYVKFTEYAKKTIKIAGEIEYALDADCLDAMKRSMPDWPFNDSYEAKEESGYDMKDMISSEGESVSGNETDGSDLEETA